MAFQIVRVSFVEGDGWCPTQHFAERLPYAYETKELPLALAARKAGEVEGYSDEAFYVIPYGANPFNYAIRVWPDRTATETDLFDDMPF